MRSTCTYGNSCKASSTLFAMQPLTMILTVIVVSASDDASRSLAPASSAESLFLSSKPLIDQRSSMVLNGSK